jgi:hypothetical protein
MNANAKFLNEAKELDTRWAKLGLLEGIDKKYSRQSSAVLLECQRLFNETGTWDCCDECREREKSELVSSDVVSVVSPEVLLDYKI